MTLRFLPLFLFVLLCGCSDTFIDPFENEDRFFTVYGFLDVLETNHAVRVIPVTRTPEKILGPAEPQAFLDAVVTSTDLTTGAVTSWKHSLERLENGLYGHIFRGQFLVQPGRTYRLEVARSDGITTTAETTIPYLSDNTLIALDPVIFSEDSTVATQHLHIAEVASPWKIEVMYQYYIGINVRHFFVPYGRTGTRTEDGGWDLTVNISDDQVLVKQDAAALLATGAFNLQDPVTLTAMGVQVRMLDKNWDPPAGVFDPEILSQPGALSNVVNGYGFWGSAGLYKQNWNISEFSRALGYD